MSDIKIESSNGQEYAHKELKHEDYQYLDEDKRVNTIDTDDKVVSYNETTTLPVKIKVVTKDNKEKVLEDHRNNVYKIQTKPQMKGFIDNPDSYKLENDPRQDEINRNNINNQVFEKQLEEEQKKDMSNPNERFSPVKVKYKIEDKVKHVEEGITGTVKFVGKDKVAILWEDGSRERFALSDLGQLSYVDDVEEEVSPLTTQTPAKKPENKSKIDNLLDAALADMEKEEDFGVVEDGNPNKDEEKIALERKVKTLENKLENNKIQNIKEKAVNEVISLMKDKGIIKNSSDEKIQRDTILKMDDVGFEAFKNAIIAMSGKKKVVAEKTDAEKALAAIRNGDMKASGGVLIDDFDLSGETTSRDLHSVKVAAKEPQLNLDGFKNLQGLTKPIQVIAEQKTPMGSIKEQIASMDWTTITKMF